MHLVSTQKNNNIYSNVDKQQYISCENRLLCPLPPSAFSVEEMTPPPFDTACRYLHFLNIEQAVQKYLHSSGKSEAFHAAWLY